MEEYEDRYRSYNFKFNWTSSEPFDPRNEIVEVRLTTRDGEEYSANFVAKCCEATADTASFAKALNTTILELFT